MKNKLIKWKEQAISDITDYDQIFLKYIIIIFSIIVDEIKKLWNFVHEINCNIK